MNKNGFQLQRYTYAVSNHGTGFTFSGIVYAKLHN